MLSPTFSNTRRQPLMIGDVVTFLVFAAIGRSAHSMGSALDDVLYTAMPFMAAWFIVGPFTGAFAPDATANAGQAAKRSALTWLLAFPFGLAIRTAIKGGALPHWSFALVAGIFTFTMLTGWRAAFARSQ